MSAQRKCSKCGQVLSVKCFGRNAQAADGLMTLCRKCANAKNQAFREAHPERVRVYSRTYRERHPEQVDAARRAWELAHREQRAAYSAARYAAKRGPVAERVVRTCVDCGREIQQGARCLDCYLERRRERRRRIEALWLAGWTQAAIAAEVGCSVNRLGSTMAMMRAQPDLYSLPYRKQRREAA